MLIYWSLAIPGDDIDSFIGKHRTLEPYILFKILNIVKIIVYWYLLYDCLETILYT